MARRFGRRSLLTALAVVASGAPAFAHPGHGTDGGSHALAHYFTEPEHLAPVGLAVFAGVATAMFVAWYRRRA